MAYRKKGDVQKNLIEHLDTISEESIIEDSTSTTGNYVLHTAMFVITTFKPFVIKVYIEPTKSTPIRKSRVDNGRYSRTTREFRVEWWKDGKKIDTIIRSYLGLFVRVLENHHIIKRGEIM